MTNKNNVLTSSINKETFQKLLHIASLTFGPTIAKDLKRTPAIVSLQSFSCLLQKQQDLNKKTNSQRGVPFFIVMNPAHKYAPYEKHCS
jgi:hypothetical protein